MFRYLGQAALLIVCLCVLLGALLTVTLGVAELADRVAASVHSDGTE